MVSLARVSSRFPKKDSGRVHFQLRRPWKQKVHRANSSMTRLVDLL